MNVLEFIEGGGLLLISGALIVFAIARNKATEGGWPKGIIPTNFFVLLIIASGFFGIATFIDSFLT